MPHAHLTVFHLFSNALFGLMMKIIADLHVHSKYSRATSKSMDVNNIAYWAKRKGINLVGTGDFTHPAYLKELKNKLVEPGNGILEPNAASDGINFILSTEISNIYTYKGKTRRVHNIILAPSFNVVEKINHALLSFGRLDYDGRPIFGFNAKDLVKLTMDISDRCMIIPAHAWTPWYSVFGSNSGFDSIEECFDEQTKNIYAIETGLSSDPPMNWRVKSLDGITLVSNSDAHSPDKLGREANVFECEMDYDAVTDAVKSKDKKRFLFTIEFYPEEGKYHFDGHRACNISLSPEQTVRYDGICPVCHKPLTIGVMNRVLRLATRNEGFIPQDAIPFRHTIPLKEIMSFILSVGVNTKKIEKIYDTAIDKGVSEMDILLDLPVNELKKLLPEEIAAGIMHVRNGNVNLTPGYDGVYGSIGIVSGDREPPQNRLF
ncbi:MAG: endonuclease Q family protein [Deltaproteobacteria bacterium]|nr:endonuclease Q family protein [Deltaproteobacteria bacterium]